MTKVIIAHGWTGHPEYVWYPHTKRELEAKGFEVVVPAFPDTNAPELTTWLPTLTAAVGEPEADLILVGHSLGCALILRYLESLTDGVQIAGVIFVAGFTDHMGHDPMQNFFQTPIDFAKIKARVRHFTFIHSDNDPYVATHYAEQLQQQLGGEVILKSGVGHFSTSPEGVICEELPEVIESVEALSAHT